jgi:hypothetical protein
MATFSENRNVRIGRTTNRQLGFITPTPADSRCSYFEERFIRHGSALKENRAICEKEDGNVLCDYRKVVDGTPFCLRYWYGPKYEIVDEKPEPYVQKKDQYGRKLYLEADGVTETTTPTPLRAVQLLSEQRPIQYVEDGKSQATDDNDNLLYWDKTVDPPVQTTTQTEYPVWVYESPQFYSKQYEDSHEKIFGINGNRLGWHLDV